jgi:hypothetical protein
MTAAALLLALAQDPAFDTLFLDAGGRADKLVSRDLDGDGKPDLLVQNGRDVHVFLFDGRGLPPRAGQVLRLDASTFLWTIGSLGAKRPALLAQGSRGIQAHAFENRAFGPAADLAVHPTIFEGAVADGRAPLLLDFAPDLDGDGASEAILFAPDELFVMKAAGAGGFRCLQKLPVPFDAAFLIPWAPSMKLTRSVSVPVLAYGDVTGDGRKDVSYFREDAVGIFRQESDGRLVPADSLAISEDRKRSPRRRFLQFDLPPKVEDFNRDGLLDFAVIFPSKGRVQVYYGRPGRTDYSTPDDLMKAADGWSTGVYLEDLDGDGRLDLVMGVVRKFGIAEGIQVFLSGKVDLELHVYPMQGDGRFSRDPVQELKFSIPFSFHVARESMNLDLVFRPNFTGDFNRDGLRDMLVATGEKTLRIYPGVKGRFIADAPSGTIAMDPPAGTSLTEPFTADFNGDGVTDLVLRHVLPESGKHGLELKLSR